MSKKNNKKIKARQHAFDIEREKKAAEETKKRQEKRAQKQAAAPAKLKVKRKPIKLRKNMRIRGVVIKDAESKRKVMKILKREQADKAMEVEGVVKRPLKRKAKAKLITPSAAVAVAAAVEAMEM